MTISERHLPLARKFLARRGLSLDPFALDVIIFALTVGPDSLQRFRNFESFDLAAMVVEHCATIRLTVLQRQQLDQFAVNGYTYGPSLNHVLSSFFRVEFEGVIAERESVVKIRSLTSSRPAIPLSVRNRSSGLDPNVAKAFDKTFATQNLVPIPAL